MSGHPPSRPSGHGYGAPEAHQYTQAPYGAPPANQYNQAPYSAPPGHQYNQAPYGAPPAQPYGPVATPYGAPSAPYAQPSAPGEKPQKHKYETGATAPGGYSTAPPAPAPYGSPFASLVPSAFPPGTDPSLVSCFQIADQDGSGFIDDKELQRALSSYNQSFSLRTVHLLMYLFTNSNARKIGQ